MYAARVRGEAGFQKLVAIKRMLPQLADDEEFVTMFLDEATVAANINSPHVVSTLDLGRADDGSLYIVMELVVGATLARLLRWSVKERSPVPLTVAVDLIVEAGQGLHDAHEATTPVGTPLHIVHRDVSPQNILVGVDGRVRLTDFGVARAVLRLTHTVGGRIKGKFAYCSPEQLVTGEVDRRSDVFALGVVAWEALTGQRLFVGEHPGETMDRVRNMPVPHVNQVRPDVPQALSDVVTWALQRDMDRRPSTALAFAEAMRAAARAHLPPHSKDDVARFVRVAGGESLAKMRANIQAALEAQDTFLSGVGPTEIGLTPSDIRSGILPRESSHSTDPVTGAAGPLPFEPDASAPGAAMEPSSLLSAPAALPPPQSRSLAAVLLGSVLVVALVGAGTAVAWWLSQSPSEPIVVPLTDPRPPDEPEPSGPHEDDGQETATTDVAGTPDPAGPDMTLTPEELAEEGTTSMRHGGTTRVRRTAMDRAATTTMETVAVTAPPTAETPPEVVTPPQMATTPPPTGARTSTRTQDQRTTQMRAGIVGLDQFDMDLAGQRK